VEGKGRGGSSIQAPGFVRLGPAWSLYFLNVSLAVRTARSVWTGRILTSASAWVSLHLHHDEEVVFCLCSSVYVHASCRDPNQSQSRIPPHFVTVLVRYVTACFTSLPLSERQRVRVSVRRSSARQSVSRELLVGSHGSWVVNPTLPPGHNTKQNSASAWPSPPVRDAITKQCSAGPMRVPPACDRSTRHIALPPSQPD
jgi:hypothetical protein